MTVRPQPSHLRSCLGLWLCGSLLVVVGLGACGTESRVGGENRPASGNTRKSETVPVADAGSDRGSEVAQAGTTKNDSPKSDGGKAAGKFTDPAPPKVNKLDESKPLPPLPYSRVKFHGKPKPLPKGAVTHDWTSFLGPTHNAISTETKLQKKWPKDGPKVVWEMETGDGYSSPAIQGDYLVYPHRVKDEVLVECLHPETGQLYWHFKYATNYRDKYQYSNGPRCSPVIDDDRVYIYSAEGKLFCLKLETGQVIWQRHINEEFKVPQHFFGTATNPVLEGDKLIINVGAPGGPCVVGIDKMSGKVVWAAGDKWGPSYASPVPATIHGKRRVMVFAGGDSDPPTGGLLSIDPANGAVDFEFPWRSRKYESVNASCPVVVGNQVFITASYRTGSALLAINNDFSFTKVWTTIDREHNTAENELGLHWNMPVHKDGFLYGFDGRNEPDASMVCVSLKTGKVVWRKNPTWEEVVTIDGRKFRDPNFSTLRGSLLFVDGRGLCLGEFGHLLWLDLNPDGYKELDRAWLFNSVSTWSPPVVSRGLLYISKNSSRGYTSAGYIQTGHPRLLCYDLRADAEK